MSIKEELQKLKENDLRKKIVIPYLKVCYPNVEDWHGSGEKGKDIIYITFNEAWKRYVVGAVIIKNNGDITMSGGKKTNLRILSSQLFQTLKEPISFPLDPRQKAYIEEITILTSYHINRPARDFIRIDIYPHMPIVYFISGGKFEEIIQLFIKDKNNEFNINYEFDCNTFESFCIKIPCSSRIKEKMKKINIKGEARSIDEDLQSKNKF